MCSSRISQSQQGTAVCHISNKCTFEGPTSDISSSQTCSGTGYLPIYVAGRRHTNVETGMHRCSVREALGVGVLVLLVVGLP
jgi:hypothetical protein